MESAELEVRVPVGPTKLAAGPAGGDGWRPLFGRFRTAHLRFEWHDFEIASAVDWSERVSAGCLEICLNLGECASLAPAGARCMVE